MRLTIIAALLVLCNFASLTAVELTVKERSGIDRIDEPVTSGIPLPQGYEDNAAHLYLESGGKAIKAHIRPVNRWPDGSLRWVQTDFVASLVAGQEMPLLLVRGNAPTIESALKVVEDNSHIMVSNGLIKAEVKKSGFNVLDRVELISNGRPLVENNSRGLSTLVGGVEYLSANDRDCTVEVESQNPVRVVVRAVGKLKDSSGNNVFDYVCRLYFNDGTPVVRVVYSIEYHNQDIEKKVVIEDLGLELKLTEKESFVIGRDGGNVMGKLPANGSAWVFAPSSDKYSFGGAASHGRNGNPKVEMYGLPGEGECVVPLLLFVPEGEGSFPAKVFLHPDGKQAEAAAGAGIERMVRAGVIVAAPDLSGIGETAASGSTAFTGVLVGRSVVGVQAADIVRTVNFLKQRSDVVSTKIDALAKGSLCPALLHAAAFDNSVSTVTLQAGPVSYASIVMNRYYRWQFDCTVSGALTAYDLQDLAATIAPRPLILTGTLDHMKEPMSAETVQQKYTFTRQIYKSAGGSLTIR
ncbi:hypothetical protein ACFL4X_01935 [Gemmatimonadota bacterium]